MIDRCTVQTENIIVTGGVCGVWMDQDGAPVLELQAEEVNRKVTVEPPRPTPPFQGGNRSDSSPTVGEVGRG